MSNRVYVLTTVDTEEEWDWSGPFPVSKPVTANIRKLPAFQDVCSRFGMRSTYFTNFSVMDDPESAAVIRALHERDDVEIGMHIHPWNTPPDSDLIGSPAKASFLHNHSDAVIRQKLETVYDSFAQTGIFPTSFRGGRYSSGGPIHEFLRERKFVADCSVVPYTTWPDEGAPDFRHRDVFPVRLPPASPDQPPLWEIPLSMGFSRAPFRLWARLFDLIETTPLAKLRLIGLAERLRLVRRVWLNFEIADPHDWTPFLLLLQRMGVPCVTLTVHSSSLTTGPGPYTRTPLDESRIFQQIEQVFSAIRGLPGFIPATASEAAQHLENMHAGSRN